MSQVIASDKKGFSWEESIKMCSLGVCKHFGFDMDGDVCKHPVSFQHSPSFGLNMNAMISTGECTGAFDDPSKNQRQLFEPVDKGEL